MRSKISTHFFSFLSFFLKILHTCLWIYAVSHLKRITFISSARDEAKQLKDVSAYI